eukprot:jgi/Bigna1/77909/fgenesh1_pg.51_\
MTASTCVYEQVSLMNYPGNTRYSILAALQEEIQIAVQNPQPVLPGRQGGTGRGSARMNWLRHGCWLIAVVQAMEDRGQAQGHLSFVDNIYHFSNCASQLPVSSEVMRRLGTGAAQLWPIPSVLSQWNAHHHHHHTALPSITVPTWLKPEWWSALEAINHNHGGKEKDPPKERAIKTDMSPSAGSAGSLATTPSADKGYSKSESVVVSPREDKRTESGLGVIIEAIVCINLSHLSTSETALAMNSTQRHRASRIRRTRQGNNLTVVPSEPSMLKDAANSHKDSIGLAKRNQQRNSSDNRSNPTDAVAEQTKESTGKIIENKEDLISLADPLTSLVSTQGAHNLKRGTQPSGNGGEEKPVPMTPIDVGLAGKALIGLVLFGYVVHILGIAEGDTFTEQAPSSQRANDEADGDDAISSGNSD